MKKPLVILFVVVIAIGAFFGRDFWSKSKTGPIEKLQTITQKPFDKYTYEALVKTDFPASEITVGNVISDDPTFVSRMFYFSVGGPSTSSGQAKRVSGLLNIPKKEGNLPVIVLLRGFVEPSKYTTGVGTQHDGEVFAKNGYITLAPDFLGYGESDKALENSFEDRFLTYTTTMTLLNSLTKLNPSLLSSGYKVSLDPSKVGIWGHSNGGQIALSVLEISGKPYPAVLWAPVSKPFPYSILYYTDEFDDNGKALRLALSGFEENYDSEKYSLTNYFGRIKAPMQINQGLADIEVPYWWSDDLAAKLSDLGISVEYFKYPGEDHNFDHGSWSTAISRSVQFFNDKLNSQ